MPFYFPLEIFWKPSYFRSSSRLYNAVLLSLVFLVFFHKKRGEKKFRKGIRITVLILMATHKLIFWICCYDSEDFFFLANDILIVFKSRKISITQKYLFFFIFIFLLFWVWRFVLLTVSSDCSVSPASSISWLVKLQSHFSLCLIHICDLVLNCCSFYFSELFSFGSIE